MNEYAVGPVIAWLTTVGITYVATDSIVNALMVGFLAGMTALVAFATGRGVGRMELEQEQKADRRQARAPRKRPPGDP